MLCFNEGRSPLQGDQMAKKGRGIKILITLIIIIVALFFVAAWYFSSVLMHPGPFQCTKEHFVYCGDPGEQNIPFENISFKTADNLTIRGWYMPAKNPAKAVILAHGRGANKNEGMRFARALHHAGFNLLTFDFRNCGESDKSFNSLGYHEKKDIYAAIDYLINVKKITDIGIMERSCESHPLVSVGAPPVGENHRFRGIFCGHVPSPYGEIICCLEGDVLERDLLLSGIPAVDKMHLFALKRPRVHEHRRKIPCCSEQERGDDNDEDNEYFNSSACFSHTFPPVS